jgi:hypothetical protein
MADKIYTRMWISVYNITSSYYFLLRSHFPTKKNAGLTL